MNNSAHDDRRWICAFTPPSSCMHRTLFSESYQRTNRTNRTKIVRCFPHCCPEHRTRSYCCTSLHLTVTLPVDAINVVGLQVFARFRSVDDTEEIHENDTLPASTILRSLQSTEQPTATWIASRVVFRLRNVVVFEINPEARWLYAWTSGATMTQRLLRHLLEAIVVLPSQQLDALQVVAVIHSPTFTFSSFRHNLPSDAQQRNQSYLFRALSSQLEEESTDEDEKKESYVPPPYTPAVDSTSMETTWTTMDETDGTFARQLDALIHHVVQQPAAPFRHLVPPWDPEARQLVVHPRPTFMDVHSIAVHLVWWIHTNDHLLREVAVHTSRAVQRLEDPDSLRAAFHEWRNRLRRLSNAFLERHGYSWDALRLDQFNQPQHSYNTGYQRFVTQVRQHAISHDHVSRAVGLPDLPTWMCEATAIQSHVFQSQRKVVIDGIELVSVGLLLVFWIQLGRLRMAFDAPRNCLCLQAPLGSWPTQSIGLEMLLDHTFRTFSILPNGESSFAAAMLTGYSIGDYIGFPATTGGIPRLHVTLFAWSTDNPPRAYRWHWTVPFPDERLDTLALTVRVDAAQFTRETTTLESLPFNEKLRLVTKWSTQFEALIPYHRQVSPADEDRKI